MRLARGGGAEAANSGTMVFAMVLETANSAIMVFAMVSEAAFPATEARVSAAHYVCATNEKRNHKQSAQQKDIFEQLTQQQHTRLLEFVGLFVLFAFALLRPHHASPCARCDDSLAASRAFRGWPRVTGRSLLPAAQGVCASVAPPCPGARVRIPLRARALPLASLGRPAVPTALGIPRQSRRFM